MSIMAFSREKPDDARTKELKAMREKLRPLFQPLGKPQPGEWLYHHEETGQTFDEYLRSSPVIPDAKRKVIYIQPLGEFTEAQRKVVALTADFIGKFYGMSVKVQEDLPLSVIPESARRVHPTWGVNQILSTYVLDEVLKPKLPKDAFALIAFTAQDLYPAPDWNFVFGQASLRERVGVWSIYRFGDPSKGQDEFRLALLRTMHTGVHELGHMFSILHCTAYACGMCGSNSLPESDQRPLAFCPEDVAKVCWATNADPVKRYEKLRAFCEEHGLAKEAEFYGKCIRILQGN
jgi:archaemetzincin